MLCSGINSTALVELTKPDTVAEIADGVEINLRCHANGNPDPAIEWYRNRIKYVYKPMIGLFIARNHNN